MITVQWTAENHDLMRKTITLEEMLELNVKDKSIRFKDSVVRDYVNGLDIQTKQLNPCLEIHLRKIIPLWITVCAIARLENNILTQNKKRDALYSHSHSQDDRFCFAHKLLVTSDIHYIYK